MRWWHESVATVGDLVPGGVPVLGVILTLVTVLGTTLWFFYPEWLPRWRRPARQRGDRRRWRWRRRRGTERSGPRWRWRGLWRWGRFRLRWRRRRRTAEPPPAEPAPADELPLTPAAELAVSADQLAAQGRYAEAVRERLRAIVRELVERQVLGYQAGWTVTELAAAGGAAVPAAAAPLAAASETFSRIWYGHRPAGPAEDAAMRNYAAEVTAALSAREVPV
ncbi:DUF4129 domain-containing protein [Natronosporangium hydrolyticum]|uniref:DUF4129 domain-containing protein n=1 Tax=Natronosporangium hydrolyticum TaxID=2811111 RepID=A0A895YPR4_9ACTN|nr:DUF4129 domain-containing protein [Natronosporangium hydrolyticum]QSB15958.1 DUF4129 domain-containing protein [Natronosporangium hydrolyticum]